jgi:hypothetical protein
MGGTGRNGGTPKQRPLTLKQLLFIRGGGKRQHRGLTMHKFTLEAGRAIYRDGKPFIAIMRCGDTQPVDADNAAREIAAKVYLAPEDKLADAKRQGQAQFDSIKEMVEELRKADLDAIIEGPSGWNGAGSEAPAMRKWALETF